MPIYHWSFGRWVFEYLFLLSKLADIFSDAIFDNNERKLEDSFFLWMPFSVNTLTDDISDTIFCW